MQIDFNQLTPNQRYGTMVQTVVPRPIAWVLSDNGDDSYNVAPFSFFTCVSHDPAVLMFSVGRKDQSEEKDTRVNIKERENFVLHIASTRHISQVNATSKALAHGVSEVDEANLALTDIDGFPLPRIADCGVAFACKRYRIDEIGEGTHAVIYGEIQSLIVDDDLLIPSDKYKVVLDALKLDPLARLGGDNYSGLGEQLSAQRPNQFIAS